MLILPANVRVAGVTLSEAARLAQPGAVTAPTGAAGAATTSSLGGGPTSGSGARVSRGLQVRHDAAHDLRVVE